jgi:hypothetical protein
VTSAELVLLGRRAGAPARSVLAAPSRRSSGSGAPYQLSLLPPAGALAASLSTTGHRFDTKDAFLIADVVFAILLLGLASLPARTLANARLAAVVVPRRVELALVGAATLAIAVVAALLSGR